MDNTRGENHPSDYKALQTDIIGIPKDIESILGTDIKPVEKAVRTMDKVVYDSI